MAYGVKPENGNRIAAGLVARGMERGERFALLIRNHPQFIEAMVVAIEAAMPSSCGPFTIHAPLMRRSKKSTVLLAQELGDECWEAVGRSVTCYRGKRPGCDRCPACRLRQKGFEEAGLEDPARVQLEGEEHE